MEPDQRRFERTDNKIKRHFDRLEKTIGDDPLVVLSDFHRVYTSPATAFVKGKARFINNSLLNIFQHVRINEGKLFISDYRYHYMDSASSLIFRYDNAEHHPEIKTSPHHKHLPSCKIESANISIKKLLTEINQKIIEEIITGLN